MIMDTPAALQPAVADVRPGDWRALLRDHAPHIDAAIVGLGMRAEASADLPLLVRSFIRIGVDLVVTHLYPASLPVHVRSALAQGATPAQIVEVAQIACATASSAYADAHAALERAQAASGRADIRDDSDDDDFSTALAAVCAQGGPDDGLDAKTRAIVAMAVNASAPVRDLEAVEREAEAALAHGATSAQLVQALRFTAGLGAHAFATLMPIAEPLFAAWSAER